MPIHDRLFSPLIETGRQAMNLLMERQGLIQSNVANLETPGYTMQDFSFAEAMRNATRNQERLTRTHAAHIPLDPLEATASMSFAEDQRPVDLDEEMLKLSENQLAYQINSKILGKKFEGLRLAIDEGGK